MDRTTAACAGLAINSMFADAGDWGALVVQIVRTGATWHVEVRRDGDVYANGRDENRVDVTDAEVPAHPAADLARELEAIAHDLDGDDPIQSGHILQARNRRRAAALRALAAGVREQGSERDDLTMLRYAAPAAEGTTNNRWQCRNCDAPPVTTPRHIPPLVCPGCGRVDGAWTLLEDKS